MHRMTAAYFRSLPFRLSLLCAEAYSLKVTTPTYQSWLLPFLLVLHPDMDIAAPYAGAVCPASLP